MPFDEEHVRFSVARAYEEYKRDPVGFLQRSKEREQLYWIAFLAIYVPISVIALIYNFPSTADINVYLANPRFRHTF